MAGKVAGKNEVRNANFEVFQQNDASYGNLDMFIEFSLCLWACQKRVRISRSQHDNRSKFCNAAHYSYKNGWKPDPVRGKTCFSLLAMFSEL